jgi:phage terminase large subunit-like protein
MAEVPTPAAPEMDRHVATGLAYCRDVVAGRVPAGRLVRLACQRQLDDLSRAEAGGWPYRFDEKRAGRAARFLEQLPHVKGPMAGQLFRLEPWQCFIVTTAFGWVREDTGARRFRRVYIEVPRGNGKSFLSSGIALYGLAADGESGAEVYSAATTTAQAKITYGDAERMLRKRPALMKKLGIRISTTAIAQLASGSTFGALSREARNHDGKNIHLAVIDELHAHRTRELWDVIITGAAKRPQSLIWTITTAGVDTSGICYEVRDGVVKMLEGAANEGLFGVVYSLDESDDWKDASCWAKANPNWHASIDHDSFRLAAIEAQQSAAKENNFKTKHLNLWCNAAVAWMDLTAWDKCADTSLRLEDFAGQRCTMGLDLASKVDVAAAAKLFARDMPAPTAEEPHRTQRHFFLFLDSFLPEAAVHSARNAQYVGWAKTGRLRTTPGDVLDFEAVHAHVLEAQQRHDLREVAFDPWQATQLSNQLQSAGVTMVEVRPTVQSFSEPMKHLEALVLQGRIHHDGNPVLRWMMSNVVAHRDAKDNIYPRKERAENKIDGVVAALMALNRALLVPEEEGSVYEDRGVRLL